ncbi:MAG: DUF3568 family protein [Phycisphaerales bacterium]|nr:MAG: DUF3568 family protein [Phycisphaerales bacterium]
MKHRIILAALLLATISLGVGCTTTVINPGTDTSATYRLGQLTAQEDKDIASVYAATEAAVDELGLSVIQKVKDELEANIVARDAQDKKIVIELVSLTKGTTEVKVKVASPDKAGRIYQTIHDKL